MSNTFLDDLIESPVTVEPPASMTNPPKRRNIVSRYLRDKVTWAVLISLVIIIAAFRGGSSGGDIYLDPQSTKSDGTKALIELMDQLGTNVTVGTEVGGNVALVLQDDLDQQQSDDLEQWVERGNTLVLADSNSTLAVGRPASSNTRPPLSLTPSCTTAFVRGVSKIEPEPRRNYELLNGSENDQTCFKVHDAGFMVVSPQGFGTVVQLGGPDIFTNGQLGKADNSVLLANILNAGKGTHLTVLQGDPNGDAVAQGGLGDLIPSGIRQSEWQIVLAGFFLMLWRGRRLGKPLDETPIVEVPASALVLAVGNLLQTAGQARGAADVIRNDLRKSIAELLGMAPDIDPGVLAQITAARTGIDEARLRRALIDGDVPNGDALLNFAQDVENVHREVMNAR